MDIVQRVILAVLLMLPLLAHAADEQIPAPYKQWRLQSPSSWYTGESRGSDPSALCTAYISEYIQPGRPGAGQSPGDMIQLNHREYMCRSRSSTGSFSNVISVRMWVSCSGLSWVEQTPNANSPVMCTVPACTPPQVRQSDGSCAEPPKCTPGCNGVCGTEQPLTARGTLACFSGCYYGLGDAWGFVISNGKDGNPVKTWWTDVEDNTGVPCDAPPDEQPDGAEEAPETPDLPDPCPECECARKGHSYGTVNGTAVCLKPGTPGSKPVEIAPKPGTTTTTPAPTPENPNPESTTTPNPSTVITITPGSGAGSQPTITETTTNPDGSTTSTSEQQDKYCEKNPNAKVCKDADKEDGKGKWGGGCGSWECEGDAANCAMARKIHQDRCDDLEGMEQFADAANQGQRLLHGESDEEVTAFLNREGDGNRTINVGSMVSESGNYQFAASCISDVQFSIGGHSVSVPISKVCPYFEMIGYFLLAAAYLAALRIVGII
ncbi:hypothetical protein IHQ56_10655 [Methylobacillus flagellatus]|uniref:virulence factor TspB C-terminal domain-related protein n=1 Tax=Methylobacillus flagellatus TaxID=405 RepID=UPI002853E2DB|nr:virulence factor TspB C-terminal domain-related protein [Methylobacillus flagellatus]MDR5172279.1 hypothetical protein [Methylobacillus flagellatus]